MGDVYNRSPDVGPRVFRIDNGSAPQQLDSLALRELVLAGFNARQNAGGASQMFGGGGGLEDLFGGSGDGPMGMLGQLLQNLFRMLGSGMDLGGQSGGQGREGNPSRGGTPNKALASDAPCAHRCPTIGAPPQAQPTTRQEWARNEHRPTQQGARRDNAEQVGRCGGPRASNEGTRTEMMFAAVAIAKPAPKADPKADATKHEAKEVKAEKIEAKGVEPKGVKAKEPEAKKIGAKEVGADEIDPDRIDAQKGEGTKDQGSKAEKTEVKQAKPEAALPPKAVVPTTHVKAPEPAPKLDAPQPAPKAEPPKPAPGVVATVAA